jgi:DNA-directed RNA polymerase
MTKQIADVLKDRKQSTKGAKDLAYAIYRAIEGMVPSAKAVRDFLEQLTNECTKHKKALRWTTPLGMPVVNRYHKFQTKDVSVPLDGRRRRAKLTVGHKNEIDRNKAVNAVTANFIHSSDAVHLQMVALEANKEGIALATVHDCFGAVAPKVLRMLCIIREQFVRLHKDHALLDWIRESAERELPKNAELASPPIAGDLDLEQVLVSQHAFK